MRLVGTAKRHTSQLAIMDMKSWSFTVNEQDVDSIILTKFFDDLIKALETYNDDRAASFANASRQFVHNVLYTMLLNLAHRSPGLNLSRIFKKLPQDTDVTVVTPMGPGVPGPIGRRPRARRIPKKPKE